MLAEELERSFFRGDGALSIVAAAMVAIAPMIGGSGPNYPFVHALGLPVVTAGVGYPGSQAHAPNENMRLDLYLKGAEHIARIIKEFGKSG